MEKKKLFSILLAVIISSNCWGQVSFSGSPEVIDDALYIVNGSEKVLMSYIKTIQGEGNIFSIADGTTEIAPNAIKINAVYNTTEKNDHKSKEGSSGLSWAWAYGYGYTYPEQSSITIEIPANKRKIGANAISISDNVSVTYKVSSSTTMAASNAKEVNGKTEIARYNLQGIPVHERDKGIQIVIYSDYSTKTVIVE